MPHRSESAQFTRPRDRRTFGTAYRPSKLALVVAALTPVLRWSPGRNPGDNDDTTRHLSGRSVRALAFGLAFMFSASRMTTRECASAVAKAMSDKAGKAHDERIGVKSLAVQADRNYRESMPAVTLKAHFNGKQIVLDEPFDLPPDAPLIVTVMPKEDSTEDAQWHSLAAAALARAYGEDEPDYSAADVQQ